MREILFRGKRINNGEWVEGGYYLDPYPNKTNIVRWNSFGLGFDEIIEVYPETVSEYTGIRDKNSRRIFEGDIVKIPDDYDTYGINAGEVYEVYFGFGGFRLKPKYRKNARGFFLEDDGEVEVIGNIHDHPELIAEVEG